MMRRTFYLLGLLLLLLVETVNAGAASKSLNRGQALRPGDCIGILAPASATDRDRFQAAVKNLKRLGFRLKIGKSCYDEYGYFAGTDASRAADLNRFFRDDEVKAILCMRGGYGTARILGKLDYREIARHPKQLIGYSDITALHIALGERSGLSTVHGPMLMSFSSGFDKSNYTEKNFLQGLYGKLYPGELPLPPGKSLQTVTPGKAEGIIMGGNLAVIASMVGTPYEMKGDGALLLLEDVSEVTYRVDRMLQQLWQSGLLSRVNGILLGDFLGAEDDYEEGDFRLEEVLDYYARLSGKPVIKGLPVGHGDDNLYLPLGVHAVMHAKEDGSASLVIDEPATAP